MRHGIKDMVSSGDTISGTSKVLGDKVHTLWFLRRVTTLEEDES
jgi:hypothetical protein